MHVDNFAQMSDNVTEVAQGVSCHFWIPAIDLAEKKSLCKAFLTFSYGGKEAQANKIESTRINTLCRVEDVGRFDAETPNDCGIHRVFYGSYGLKSPMVNFNR